MSERNHEKDYFVFSLTEKINLGNYSSVDLFASIGREIDDTDEDRQEVIDIVEDIIATERTKVIEFIKSQ